MRTQGKPSSLKLVVSFILAGEGVESRTDKSIGNTQLLKMLFIMARVAI